VFGTPTIRRATKWRRALLPDPHPAPTDSKAFHFSAFFWRARLFIVTKYRSTPFARLGARAVLAAGRGASLDGRGRSGQKEVAGLPGVGVSGLLIIVFLLLLNS